MKISAIKSTGRRLVAGGWVENIPGFPGVALRVTSRNTVAARDLRETLLREIPREERIAGLMPSQADDVDAKVARSCLFDWAGIEGDDGAGLPFGDGVVDELYYGEDGFAFRAAVAWACDMVGEVGKEDLEATAGN